MTASTFPVWACSAAGSAPEWHSGGHRFDPGQVHHPSLAGFAARATDGRPPRTFRRGWLLEHTRAHRQRRMVSTVAGAAAKVDCSDHPVLRARAPTPKRALRLDTPHESAARWRKVIDASRTSSPDSRVADRFKGVIQR